MFNLAQLGNDLHSGARQFDFIGKRRRWYVLTLVLISIAAIGIGFRGLNFSLEFSGGSEVRVSGVSNLTNYEERVSKTMAETTGITGNLSITTIGSDTVRVQTKDLGSDSSQTDKLRVALAKAFSVNPDDVTSSYVGPSWGKTVTQKAIQALVLFLLLVSLVLSLYFRTWKMSLAALVALVHDVFFTVGAYALFGFEVSPATMIGFLTILGYSIYDTVVVFDKVRENTEEAFLTGERSFSQATNYAVNQTLVRSINTSIVALLPIAAIMFAGITLLGPGTLLDLSLALFIGIAVGTYSSVFIAPPVLTDLRAREEAVQELARKAKNFQENHSAESTPSGVMGTAKKIAAERQKLRRKSHPSA